ncbi:MAG: type III-B CRISPR module RAMP protein Cmr1 [Pseudonocardiales bacterium]
MSWTRLTLEVRTPLFGGEDPTGNDGSPARVPAIRGALRFWFRALAAGHGVTDLAELWKAEEAVFGSTNKPSVIGLRVLKQPTMGGRGTKPGWATTERRDFDGAQYLLGQGLWDYGTGLRRGVVEPDVKPNAEFFLDLRFSRDDQVNARFMLALWAWLTYGGLGARTRRGFGQFVCTGVRDELPCGWTLNHLLPPADVDDWQALGRCAVPDTLPGRDALGWGGPLPEDAPVAELSEFPALAPHWWTGFMLDEEADSLGAVLHLAGLRWRRFRAADGSDYLEPEKKPGPSTRSPEWTNVIHGADQRYPVAALGLPVGYFSQSQGRKFTATVTPHLGQEKLRRASPVWLRPVRLRDGRWGVFTHVFFAQLLPLEAELRITGSVTRTLPSPPVDDIRDVWDCWISGEPRLPNRYFPGS